MANIASAAIVTAVEEVLEGALGTVRTLATTELASGTYPSLNDGERARRAMVRPRFDVQLTRVTRHPSSPSEKSSYGLYQIEVVVSCDYKLSHEISEADRKSIRAQAITDAEQARQALGWPGNLTQTAAAVATGIVSGLLTFEGFEVENEDFETRLLKTRLTFAGVANVTMAVS